MKSVIVLGPGPDVRGGITSVIKAHRMSVVWQEFDCHWISTYSDRGAFWKIVAFISALCMFCIRLPGSCVVHIHVAAHTSFYRKSVFFCLAKIARRKVIVHLHAPCPEAFHRGFLGLWSGYVFASASVVVVLSEIWGENIGRKCGSVPVIVLPNPALCVDREQVCDASLRQRAVLFCGKLEPRKGYRDLITALSLWPSNSVRPHLHFAGHGEVDDARRLCCELGLTADVTFHGWLGSEALSALRALSQVFCLPSFGEGVPMSMLEAMGGGVAVIVTPVGGVPDVVVDSVNGLLVSAGDCDGIAKAMVRLLDDDGFRQRLAMNAWKTVDERFGLEKTGACLADLYRGVLP